MPEASRSIEFGLRDVAQVPWQDLNVLEQTRKTYATESHLELVKSIEALDDTGLPQFELIHPLLVNVLDTPDAEEYVNELNRCHGTSHTLSEMTPTANGKYVIVIAGHRRRLAMGQLIEKYHADPASTVACNVRTNLPFAKALRLQIDENTHLQLPVYEVAKAIQATYKYGLATGAYASFGDCVQDMPFGEAKIRDALRFCELPEIMQAWVEEGRLPYGASVALQPLQVALRKRYEDNNAAEREEIVENSLVAESLRIIRHRWGRDVVAERVRSVIQSLGQPTELSLFEVSELEIARQNRRQAYRELAGEGVRLIRNFVELNNGSMMEDLPVELQEAILDDVELLRAALLRSAVFSGRIASDQSLFIDPADEQAPSLNKLVFSSL